jgi:excisionase family DNA binding protein
MNQIEIDEIYKLEEVAKWMRCSRATIYRLLRNGELSSLKFGGSRMIAKSQLLEFIEKQKQKGAPVNSDQNSE